MVDNYNRFRERLAELTRYDTETNTGSVLTGDATALRLETDLAYLLSGWFDGAGPIHSIRELGISLEDDGTLQLDESVLRSRYAEDPEAVRQFFAEKQFGLSDKLDELITRLAGLDDSLMAGRLKALDSKIEENEKRIAEMNARLDIRRNRLLLEFYNMELAIARLQSNLSALESVKPLPSIIGTTYE
jgi:flagellar hook-associated protein 2